ncbi:hypothetical protein I2I05_12285 [Hymenobacter sp. BT683]|uniref:Glycerophosphoryl diester phosphodiesterase membrane domain-containing protein n=1 Tax=Hymenobacter jeongseonensis TaxID=2791027 RepID=A0ABS0IJI1_9BACT|nr:hypothetical protein [Hymenobacter jeongseonensis]MBF9238174.1 hypothetical protein [Hymenobacter jeongseonensis]
MQAKVKFNQEADFRRERDFGAKVGATFEFVVAQFRPLMKCLLYFVLPGALLAGIGLGLFMSNFLKIMPQLSSQNGGGRLASGYPGNMFTTTSFMGLGVATLGFLAAFVLLSCTVYAFVRVRISIPSTEVVQPAQVWAFVWRRLGRVVRAGLVLGLVVGGGSLLLMAFLAALWPGLVVLGFFPLVWAGVCLTLFYPIIWMEDDGVMASLRRSFYLIKGKWWSTVGLYLVMSFITGILNYVFIIPFYGLMVVRMMLKIPGFDSEILSVGAMSIYALGWIFTAVLPLVAMLFQYFNLVERKDGVGLSLLVNSLGQTAAPQVHNRSYQPDEEGEY